MKQQARRETVSRNCVAQPRSKRDVSIKREKSHTEKIEVRPWRGYDTVAARAGSKYGVGVSSNPRLCILVLSCPRCFSR
jgi:hypothetical protein